MVQVKKLIKFNELRHYFFNKFDLDGNQVYRDLNDKSVTCRQSHSTRVAIITKFSVRNPSADAMITDRKLSLAIQTADCLPILFYETKKKIIAAVHAGWKGLEKGIIRETLLRIYQLGGDPRKIIGAIGPHIGVCCYSVDYHRLLKFIDQGFIRSKIAKKTHGKWYLDLGRIAQISMIKNGMKQVNIETVSDCTSCNHEYFSYRRDKTDSGRMFSVIGLGF